MPSESTPVFQLSSTDIAPDSEIPSEFLYNGFGCTGTNMSPALSWSGAPEGTNSFAITVFDPDAPTGSGWWHWIVYDISPKVTELKTGAGVLRSLMMPVGAKVGTSDYGTKAYGGPCPPKGHGVHHYVFTVFALTVETLDVPDDASAALIGFNLHGNMLAKASFTALYSR